MSKRKKEVPDFDLKNAGLANEYTGFAPRLVADDFEEENYESLSQLDVYDFEDEYWD